jgi:hypothetical protein
MFACAANTSTNTNFEITQFLGAIGGVVHGRGFSDPSLIKSLVLTQRSSNR